MSKLSNENIVRLYDVYNDEEKNLIYIIMEYCDGGNLR